MSREGARRPSEERAEETGADDTGADTAGSIAQLAVVGHDDEAVGATRIWPTERIDDLIVCRTRAAVTEDIDLHSR